MREVHSVRNLIGPMAYPGNYYENWMALYHMTDIWNKPQLKMPLHPNLFYTSQFKYVIGMPQRFTSFQKYSFAVSGYCTFEIKQQARMNNVQTLFLTPCNVVPYFLVKSSPLIICMKSNTQLCYTFIYKVYCLTLQLWTHKILITVFYVWDSGLLILYQHYVCLVFDVKI